jgi:hypothetical protein
MGKVLDLTSHRRKKKGQPTEDEIVKAIEIWLEWYQQELCSFEMLSLRVQELLNGQDNNRC